jgi:hypothetical protein
MPMPMPTAEYGCIERTILDYVRQIMQIALNSDRLLANRSIQMCQKAEYRAKQPTESSSFKYLGNPNCLAVAGSRTAGMEILNYWSPVVAVRGQFPP